MNPRTLVTALPFILAPVFAQEAPPPLPPAISGAIHRMVTGDHTTPVIAYGGAEFSGAASRLACSVPLLEMHIDHPEQFALRTAPVPAVNDSMPPAQPPAPRCAR